MCSFRSSVAWKRSPAKPNDTSNSFPFSSTVASKSAKNSTFFTAPHTGSPSRATVTSSNTNFIITFTSLFLSSFSFSLSFSLFPSLSLSSACDARLFPFVNGKRRLGEGLGRGEAVEEERRDDHTSREDPRRRMVGSEFNPLLSLPLSFSLSTPLSTGRKAVPTGMVLIPNFRRCRALNTFCCSLTRSTSAYSRRPTRKTTRVVWSIFPGNFT
mmetsp:Transcript_25180/g.70584  ORF Transcript_25180/g.70584 Transcript_25180/m.70584 type:complete len:213 (+) Transcript_25180:967-1605(+)